MNIPVVNRIILDLVNQGYRQVDLAQKIGVSEGTMSLLVRGQATLGQTKIERLAKLYEKLTAKEIQTLKEIEKLEFKGITEEDILNALNKSKKHLPVSQSRHVR